MAFPVLPNGRKERCMTDPLLHCCYPRMCEAKFLTGVIARSLCENGRLHIAVGESPSPGELLRMGWWRA